MNFLAKLVQAIGFLPTIIGSVENLFRNKSGSDKKNAVMSFLQNALSLADAVVANDVVDADGFKSGLSQIVDGTVACLNASIWAPKAQ
jgi:hypothetical protein